MSRLIVMENDNTPAEVIGEASALGVKLAADGWNADTGSLLVLAESNVPEKPTVVIAFPESEKQVADLLLASFPSVFSDQTQAHKDGLAKLSPAAPPA